MRVHGSGRKDDRSQVERLRAAQPLLAELRNLYLLAGGPSSRVLAKRIGEETDHRISHTTVNGALNGTVLPSWQVLERIVKVLGGDAEHYRTLWAESLGAVP